MSHSFPRMLTLLRKERGLSQKMAAQELGVSQALLSHYEKGIRECGLDFLVRAADFYQVSCDELLGKMPPRTQPAQKSAASPAQETSGLGLSDQRTEQLIGSISVLFQLLETCENTQLSETCAAYLECAVYRLFYAIHTAKNKSHKGMFAFPVSTADAFSIAAMSAASAKLQSLLAAETGASKKSAEKSVLPALSPELLAAEYPKESEALFQLIREIETQMSQYQTTL